MNREAENAYWRVEKYHSEICGICREPYINQDRIYLICNHSFHEECFTQHEESIPNYTSLTCPMCRREIPRREEVVPEPEPEERFYLNPRLEIPIVDWNWNQPPPRLYQPQIKTGKRIFSQKNKSNIIFG